MSVAIAVVCLVLTLALPIYIDLAKLMEFCYLKYPGEINICCKNESLNKPEINLCNRTLAKCLVSTPLLLCLMLLLLSRFSRVRLCATP